ncbi:MAG TPA: GNAT family N-acetyltransferase [Verrucomicrobiota bacterium]|nr:GNAT family N-acetyltransferase [Verrucomicrobiota bacterium]
MTVTSETRVATLADLPGLLAVVRQFYQHFEFSWHEERKRKLLEELLIRPELGRLWLVSQDKKIVGYALVAFWFSLEFDGRTALLDEFFLVPEARGGGTGNAVLEVVESELRQDGIRVIRLEVDRAQARAATLYARRGYVASARELWCKELS